LLFTGCAGSPLPTAPSQQALAPATTVTSASAAPALALVAADAAPVPVESPTAPVADPVPPPVPVSVPVAPPIALPAPVPPPVVVAPTCTQNPLAQARFLGWVEMGLVIGSVELSNHAGTWTVRLLGASTLTAANAHQSEGVVQTITVTTPCGTGDVLRTVAGTSAFGYLWAEASLDSRVFLVSPVLRVTLSEN